MIEITLHWPSLLIGLGLGWLSIIIIAILVSPVTGEK